jgi:uncharacterized membrane protein (UPF0127 family)
MRELPEGRIFSIGDKEFNFSLATTAIELTSGLAGVVDLGPFDGMLFDFGMDWSVIMTPRGLLFPVDVAFMTNDGFIAELHRLDPENGFTQSTIREDIRFVLEVPVGFFEENDIKIGDVLGF